MAGPTVGRLLRAGYPAGRAGHAEDVSPSPCHMRGAHVLLCRIAEVRRAPVWVVTRIVGVWLSRQPPRQPYANNPRPARRYNAEKVTGRRPLLPQRVPRGRARGVTGSARGPACRRLASASSGSFEDEAVLGCYGRRQVMSASVKPRLAGRQPSGRGRGAPGEDRARRAGRRASRDAERSLVDVFTRQPGHPAECSGHPVSAGRSRRRGADRRAACPKLASALPRRLCRHIPRR